MSTVVDAIVINGGETLAAYSRVNGAMQLVDINDPHTATLTLQMSYTPSELQMARVFELYEENIEILNIFIQQNGIVQIGLRDAIGHVTTTYLYMWQVAALYRLYGAELPEELTPLSISYRYCTL